MSNKSFLIALLLVFLFPWIYTNYILDVFVDVSSAISYNDVVQSRNVINTDDGSSGGNSGGSGTAQQVDNSLTLDTLVYMAAEASEKGTISTLMKRYLEIKNNSAPGWKYIKQDHYSSGLSWTLWQNKNKANTYCLVYAGTDQVLDTMQYLPMMVNENYCAQMNEAIQVAKSIKNHASTDIKELYVVGHSLGGYLASYVVSDMVDYNVNSSNTHSRIKASDVDSTLSLSNVKCYTFGAPGYYNTPIKWPVVGGNIASLTEWGKEKKTNNENKKYNNYIFNYRNTYDPVGHLFIAPKNFKHLGYVKELNISRVSSGKINEFSNYLKKQGALGAAYRIAGLFINVSDVYYHMPHVYINAL